MNANDSSDSPDPDRTAASPHSDPNATVASPTAGQPALAGVAVPGFEIEETLGRGGMGVVYKARQRGLNRTVALKMLLAGPFADPALRQRFLLEAESVAALEHPGIVKVFAFGERGDYPYLAMEFVPGGTLAGRIKAGGPLPTPVATELVMELARAVAHAHSRGVVHRDIKPLNVLLTAEGEPRLTDFGLAKVGRADQGLSVTGQVLGTPAYMAPEQAAGKVHEVGTAADVYALGAVLYDALTGRPPFSGDSVFHTLQKVLTNEPDRPRSLNADIPRDLETICLKCLEKDPARRYPSADALAADLQAYRDGRPTVARPLGPVARVGRWIGRHPYRTAGLVAAALVAAGAVWAGVAYWVERVQTAADLNQARREAELDKRAADTERFYAGLSAVRERRSVGAAGWSHRNLTELTALAGSPLAAAHLPDLRTETASALAAVELRRTGQYVKDGRWYAAAFSADGKTLAVASWPAVNAAEVRLIDVATGATRVTLTAPIDPQEAVTIGRANGCRQVAISPDGRWVVVGTQSGHLARWDLSAPNSTAVVWAAHVTDGGQPRDRALSRLVFTSDSKTLVSQARYGVRTWDAGGGWGALAVVGWIHLSDAEVYEPDSVPITYAEDGWRFGTLHPRTGAVRKANTLSSVDTATAPSGALAFLDRFGTHGPSVRSVAPDRSLQEFVNVGRGSRRPDINCQYFTPDGGLVLTGEEFARRVAVWDVAGMRLASEAVIDGGSVRFRVAPGGREVAVCELSGVGRYELAGRVQRTVGVAPERWLETAAVSADGHSLAVLTTDLDLPLQVYRWNLGDRPSPRREDGRSIPIDWPYRKLVDLSADGKNLVYVASRHDKGYQLVSPAHGSMPLDDPSDVRLGPDGRVWVADSRAVRVVELPGWRATTAVVNDPALKPPGAFVFKSVAVGVRRAVAGRRDGMLFWMTPTGAPAGTVRVFDSAILAVGLSADEGAAIVGGERGELALVPADGSPPRSLPDAHQDAVTGVAVGTDFFATGSADGTVKFWTPRGEPLFTLRFAGGVRKIALPVGGRHLYALVEGERGLRQWDLRELHRGMTSIGIDPGFRCPAE